MASPDDQQDDTTTEDSAAERARRAAREKGDSEPGEHGRDPDSGAEFQGVPNDGRVPADD